MKLILILFTIFLISNCGHVTNTDIISNTYLEQADSIFFSEDKSIDNLFFKSETGIYVVRIKHYSTGNTLSISGQLTDRSYGHYFVMTPRKTLDKYLFNVGDGMHNSYSIRLEKNGTYTELGNPFVDFMRDQSCTALNDSLRCLYLLFSSFPREIIKVSVSFDNIVYRPLDLKLSKFMPYLWESSLRVSGNTEKIYYKIKVEGSVINLKGVSRTRHFYDSLSLK